MEREGTGDGEVAWISTGHENKPGTAVTADAGPQEEITAAHDLMTQELIALGLPQEKISQGEVRVQTLLYLCYWYHRLRNNPEEQQRIFSNFREYLGTAVADPQAVSEHLLHDEALAPVAKHYVEALLLPVKTVDLVVTKAGSEENRDKEIITLDRSYYPYGQALPGGIIKDTDEDNELNAPADVFAALRVAGEKILGIQGNARYAETVDASGKPCYTVQGETELPIVRLYPEDQGGYQYNENIRYVIRPSDPRHKVSTVGFRCVLEGEAPSNLTWRKKSDIMSLNSPDGGFAFGHHREIVAFVTGLTTHEKERAQTDREFIRSIINNPVESYRNLRERFERSPEPLLTSVPELFPIVSKLRDDMFSDEINQLCAANPLLLGLRDDAYNALRHVGMKNRDFCPYLPTIEAIHKGISFFDKVIRLQNDFFSQLPADEVIEHNPRRTPGAYYHKYRYLYRLNHLMYRYPPQIIVPTFEALSATDLMKVRGVPIWFFGLTEEPVYVDEFRQSPEEFFIHDANHSYRMSEANEAAAKEYGLTQDELIEQSNAFIAEYLAKIKVLKTDTEEQKEMKKLKKIILFEIVHEDARPFLREIVCKYIQQKEGNPVAFEVPYIDPVTKDMEPIDTPDTGINTLSYVRDKLQHGFYDEVDAQLPQIVDPKYRTARWVAKAAYEMLVELDAKPEPEAVLDDQGHVSFEWLLHRACAVGPDNIHATDEVDPDVLELGYGAKAVNIKRYQAGEQIPDETAPPSEPPIENPEG